MTNKINHKPVVHVGWVNLTDGMEISNGNSALHSDPKVRLPHSTRTFISFHAEDAAGDTNLAFNKPVTLSSLYGPETPGSLAVDGNKTGDWYVDGCACSQPELNPWILVDLEKDYKISSLYILNRQDSSRECIKFISVRECQKNEAVAGNSS